MRLDTNTLIDSLDNPAPFRRHEDNTGTVMLASIPRHLRTSQAPRVQKPRVPTPPPRLNAQMMRFLRLCEVMGVVICWGEQYVELKNIGGQMKGIVEGFFGEDLVMEPHQVELFSHDFTLVY